MILLLAHRAVVSTFQRIDGNGWDYGLLWFATATVSLIKSAQQIYINIIHNNAGIIIITFHT